MQTIIGEVSEINRLPSSANGNPRYWAFIGGERFQTSPDSMVAYALPNYLNKEVEISWRWYYGKRTIQTIKAAE